MLCRRSLPDVSVSCRGLAVCGGLPVLLSLFIKSFRNWLHLVVFNGIIKVQRGGDFVNGKSHALLSIADFKSETADMPRDFVKIFEDLAYVYRDSFCAPMGLMSVANTARSKIEKNRYTSKNRIYIVSQFSKIVLAVMDLDDAVSNHMIEHFKKDLDAEHPNAIMANYLCFLYIFQKGEFTRFSITPYDMTTLCTVFRNENLVSYKNARYFYCVNPKREAEKEA